MAKNIGNAPGVVKGSKLANDATDVDPSLTDLASGAADDDGIAAALIAVPCGQGGYTPSKVICDLSAAAGPLARNLHAYGTRAGVHPA